MHQKTACPEMLLGCDRQCGVAIKRKALHHHKQTSCPEVSVSCDLQCGATMKRKEVSDHEQTRCPQTMINCGLNCGELIMRKDLISHQLSSCLNTKLHSHYYDYEEMILRKNAEEHLSSNLRMHEIEENMNCEVKIIQEEFERPVNAHEAERVKEEEKVSIADNICKTCKEHGPHMYQDSFYCLDHYLVSVITGWE